MYVDHKIAWHPGDYQGDSGTELNVQRSFILSA